MRSLFPSKSQWQNWSLPSKLTAISAYIAIVGIILSIVFFSYSKLSDQSVKLSDQSVKLSDQAAKISDQTTKNSDAQRNNFAQPRLEIEPYDPKGNNRYHPYISAMSGASLEDRFCVFEENDWNLNTENLPDDNRGRVSMLDKDFLDLCYVPLPGILVFSLQNISGIDAADLTIRTLSLRTRIQEIIEIHENVNFNLVYEWMPFAETMHIPATRGKVTITKEDTVRAIAIPDRPEKMLDKMYRSTLAPGQEAFYVVDLDADFTGLFTLETDLIVSHHYVAETKTVIGETVFPRLLSARFSRLRNRSQVTVYWRSWSIERPEQSYLEKGISQRFDERISPSGQDFNWLKYPFRP